MTTALAAATARPKSIKSRYEMPSPAAGRSGVLCVVVFPPFRRRRPEGGWGRGRKDHKCRGGEEWKRGVGRERTKYVAWSGSFAGNSPFSLSLSRPLILFAQIVGRQRPPPQGMGRREGAFCFIGDKGYGETLSICLKVFRKIQYLQAFFKKIA